MNIALVIGRYAAAGGGAERWTDQHTRLLLRRGHNVHLVAREFAGPPAGALCHRVPVKDFHRLPARSRFAAAAERLLRTIDAQVIVDMGDGWHCDLFMPHHGTRIAGFHQNTLLLPAPLRPFRRFAHCWLPRYRQFTALERRQYDLTSNTTFLALSNMVRDHMRQYYGVPDDRIRVVYNGVDVEAFQPATSHAKRVELRRELGFDERTTVYLIVAHNFRLKGFDALLRAMQRLVAAGRAVGLIAVGDGQSSGYRRLARSLGCASVIAFVGNQADPRPYYHAADVYVQPTFYDPCSLVALEALACGLPVITTRANGAGELITPGLEGMVLDPPDDDAALARAMAAYLDADRRRDAGQAARRLAECHTLDRNTDELIMIYRRLFSSCEAA